MTLRIEQTVQQSVLDRLIDDQAATSAVTTWDESVSMLKQAVLRDLHWLLNTRRIHAPIPAELDLVRDSIYQFGLRDLSSRSADSPANRLALKREIEDVIRTFEPRLTNVRVSVPQGTPPFGAIRFHLDARLRVDPASEDVQFETTLDVGTKTIAVRERSDA